MAQTKSHCCCSVPLCTTSKRKQPYLHFHDFPTNDEQKRKWIFAIRRDIGKKFVIRTGSTKVCSRHFMLADYYEGTSRLKVGAFPTLFHWNDFKTAVAKPSICERTARAARRGEGDNSDQEELKSAAVERNDRNDHDYASPPPAGALDDALDYIAELEAKLQSMSMPQTVFSRFCVSDQILKYYTRFPSHEVFQVFWETICPSAKHIIYWTKAQRIGEQAFPKPSPARKMPLIDEFFIYSCRVAAGLKEQVIADIFETSVSTVSRTIITWTNYLFLVLGSVPIWMSRQQVYSSMPEKHKLYSPKTRVILDCTEVRCESPTSLSLQSEAFSNYKSTTTFKGLVGIAPCGTVTFVSPLYTGSISDKEITRRSGILDLLEPGDEVMVDKGFTIEDLLSKVGASLIIPPFKRSAQFSKRDCEQTQAIARLRILVERVIRRIKEYHIWDGVVPLTLSGSISQIWLNCCLMANYQGPMFLA